MRTVQNLNLQQVQRLVMTPQLRQAILILQLSTNELARRIEEELLTNPVLEAGEEAESGPEQGTGDRAAVASGGTAEDAAADPGPMAADSDSGGGLAGAELEPEWREYFLDRSDLGYTPPPPRTRSRAEGTPPTVESAPAPAPTLHEHLLSQWRLTDVDGESRRAGELILGNLDEDGYLRCPLDDIAAAAGVPLAGVTAALAQVQALEPPGVGARSLEECLLLQLDALAETEAGPAVDGRLFELARRIVREHLPDLAGARWQRIATLLAATLPEVCAAAGLVRRLDPRPGWRYGGRDETRYVVPDATIFRAGDEFFIVTNDGLLPRLTVSRFYRELLSRPGEIDPQTRHFLQANFASALWFIKSVEQRRLTLYRVVEAVADAQRDFLKHGLRRIKPLTLRQIAERLGVHESTVSRAVANKYVQTPHGTFELRYFFSSGVGETAGGGISARSVKRILADLVRAEDSRSPWSDQCLANEFHRRGILISRRTVAKYREEAGISPSAKRRRY